MDLAWVLLVSFLLTNNFVFMGLLNPRGYQKVREFKA